MIVSPFQIDFIDSSGGHTRLLDRGDLIGALLDFSARQSSETYVSIGMDWGGAVAAGGARAPLQWSRAREHSSHAAAASYAIRHPAILPASREGKIRISLDNGESWASLEAVILSVACRMDTEGIFGTLATYNIEAGELQQITGSSSHYDGMTHISLATMLGSQTLLHGVI